MFKKAKRVQKHIKNTILPKFHKPTPLKTNLIKIKQIKSSLYDLIFKQKQIIIEPVLQYNKKQEISQLNEIIKKGKQALTFYQDYNNSKKAESNCNQKKIIDDNEYFIEGLKKLLIIINLIRQTFVYSKDCAEKLQFVQQNDQFLQQNEKKILKIIVKNIIQKENNKQREQQKNMTETDIKTKLIQLKIVFSYKEKFSIEKYFYHLNRIIHQTNIKKFIQNSKNQSIDQQIQFSNSIFQIYQILVDNINDILLYKRRYDQQIHKLMIKGPNHNQVSSRQQNILSKCQILEKQIQNLTELCSQTILKLIFNFDLSPNESNKQLQNNLNQTKAKFVKFCKKNQKIKNQIEKSQIIREIAKKITENDQLNISLKKNQIVFLVDLLNKKMLSQILSQIDLQKNIDYESIINLIKKIDEQIQLKSNSLQKKAQQKHKINILRLILYEKELKNEYLWDYINQQFSLRQGDTSLSTFYNSQFFQAISKLIKNMKSDQRTSKMKSKIITIYNGLFLISQKMQDIIYNQWDEQSSAKNINCIKGLIELTTVFNDILNQSYEKIINRFEQLYNEELDFNYFIIKASSTYLTKQDKEMLNKNAWYISPQQYYTNIDLLKASRTIYWVDLTKARRVIREGRNKIHQSQQNRRTILQTLYEIFFTEPIKLFEDKNNENKQCELLCFYRAFYDENAKFNIKIFESIMKSIEKVEGMKMIKMNIYKQLIKHQLKEKSQIQDRSDDQMDGQSTDQQGQ